MSGLQSAARFEGARSASPRPFRRASSPPATVSSSALRASRSSPRGRSSPARDGRDLERRRRSRPVAQYASRGEIPCTGNSPSAQAVQRCCWPRCAFAHHPTGVSTGGAGPLYTIAATPLDKGQSSGSITFEMIKFNPLSDAFLANFGATHGHDEHLHSLSAILARAVAFGLRPHGRFDHHRGCRSSSVEISRRVRVSTPVRIPPPWAR